MSYAIGLISFVPILFGLTYYIFDFGLIRKAALTAMTMGHLSLFLPFQILLQAIILRKSILFMPLLYIVFGLPLDIAIILAFYSWGMSWSFKTESGRDLLISREWPTYLVSAGASAVTKLTVSNFCFLYLCNPVFRL